MTRPTIEELEARVRKPLDSILYRVPGSTLVPDWREEMAQDALAALTDLAARARTAEAKLREIHAMMDGVLLMTGRRKRSTP